MSTIAPVPFNRYELYEGAIPKACPCGPGCVDRFGNPCGRADGPAESFEDESRILASEWATCADDLENVLLADLTPDIRCVLSGPLAKAATNDIEVRRQLADLMLHDAGIALLASRGQFAKEQPPRYRPSGHFAIEGAQS